MCKRCVRVEELSNEKKERLQERARTRETQKERERANLLMEEIKLRIFGSPDHPVFLGFLSSDGNSVYSCGNVLQIPGTVVKICLNVTGTPVKTTLKS